MVGVCFDCEIVCVEVVAIILVSIVVSIPACHAGDPGSAPGREAFARCILRCSLLLLLTRSSTVSITGAGTTSIVIVGATLSCALYYRRKVSV